LGPLRDDIHGAANGSHPVSRARRTFPHFDARDLVARHDFERAQRAD